MGVNCQSCALRATSTTISSSASLEPKNNIVRKRELTVACLVVQDLEKGRHTLRYLQFCSTQFSTKFPKSCRIFSTLRWKLTIIFNFFRIWGRHTFLFLSEISAMLYPFRATCVHSFQTGLKKKILSRKNIHFVSDNCNPFRGRVESYSEDLQHTGISLPIINCVAFILARWCTLWVSRFCWQPAMHSLPEELEFKLAWTSYRWALWSHLSLRRPFLPLYVINSANYIN